MLSNCCCLDFDDTRHQRALKLSLTQDTEGEPNPEQESGKLTTRHHTRPLVCNNFSCKYFYFLQPVLNSVFSLHSSELPSPRGPAAQSLPLNFYILLKKKFYYSKLISDAVEVCGKISVTVGMRNIFVSHNDAAQLGQKGQCSKIKRPCCRWIFSNWIFEYKLEGLFAFSMKYHLHLFHKCCKRQIKALEPKLGHLALGEPTTAALPT